MPCAVSLRLPTVVTREQRSSVACKGSDATSEPAGGLQPTHAAAVRWRPVGATNSALPAALQRFHATLLSWPRATQLSFLRLSEHSLGGSDRGLPGPFGVAVPAVETPSITTKRCCRCRSGASAGAPCSGCRRPWNLRLPAPGSAAARDAQASGRRLRRRPLGNCLRAGNNAGRPPRAPPPQVAAAADAQLPGHLLEPPQPHHPLAAMEDEMRFEFDELELRDEQTPVQVPGLRRRSALAVQHRLCRCCRLLPLQCSS